MNLFRAATVLLILCGCSCSIESRPSEPHTPIDKGFNPKLWTDSSANDISDCKQICAPSGGLKKAEDFLGAHAAYVYCVCNDKSMQVLRFHRIVP
jgi:hypothetical protein